MAHQPMKYLSPEAQTRRRQSEADYIAAVAGIRAGREAAAQTGALPAGPPPLPTGPMGMATAPTLPAGGPPPLPTGMGASLSTSGLSLPTNAPSVSSMTGGPPLLPAPAPGATAGPSLAPMPAPMPIDMTAAPLPQMAEGGVMGSMPDTGEMFPPADVNIEAGFPHTEEDAPPPPLMAHEIVAAAVPAIRAEGGTTSDTTSGATSAAGTTSRSTAAPDSGMDTAPPPAGFEAWLRSGKPGTRVGGEIKAAFREDEGSLPELWAVVRAIAEQEPGELPPALAALMANPDARGQADAHLGRGAGRRAV